MTSNGWEKGKRCELFQYPLMLSLFSRCHLVCCLKNTICPPFRQALFASCLYSLSFLQCHFFCYFSGVPGRLGLPAVLHNTAKAEIIYQHILFLPTLSVFFTFESPVPTMGLEFIRHLKERNGKKLYT